MMERYRLSPQQERLWLLGAGADGAFVANLDAHVADPFVADRWQKSVTRLGERNEILRTRLLPVPGLKVPAQVIDPQVSSPPAVAIAAEVTSVGFTVRMRAPSLLADGPGLLALFAELMALYRGGEPEVAPQYCDLAEWQHQLLDDEADAAEAFRHWRARAGTDGALVPDLHFLRAGGQCGQPGRVPVVVPADLSAVARDAGTTAAALCAALFASLLERLAGGPVTLGWCASGRAYDELRGAPGALARVVPLIPPVGTVVAERAAAMAAEIAQAEDLQGYFRPSAQFANWLAAFDWLDLPGEVESVNAVIDAPAVLLEGRSHDDSISLTLVDALGRCDRDGLERLAEQLATLLESVVTQPATALDLLPMLGVNEAARLARFQGDVVAVPVTTLDRLVAEQAARTPDRIAVVADQGELSYAALERRANSLAHVLAARMGPERRVALVLERSLDLPVALLGCFKAGAAYVPIDPDYPAERIALMIADSGASVVLRAADLAALDLEGGDHAPLVASAADDPAYVLYTSGSTGRPKGVVVRHRELVNHMCWMQRVYPLAADDAVLQKTSFSFDASVWEFFAPLIAGARLVMARPGGQQDAAYLCQTMIRHGVTVLQAVPTLLRLLLDVAAFAQCRLKRVFCGGEALPADLVAAMRRRGGADLINLYGPTETTIEVSHWRCGADDGVATSVPIGRPIDNVTLSVRDPAGALVPIGVAGELWIAGAAVAAGYLGQPELTAQRFVTLADGGRAYRTGDLAAWRPDGALMFLGRRDHQVKIRGFRIELGEIEAVLRGHPGVHDAVAVVEGEGSYAQIVGIIEADPGIDAAAVRARAVAALPVHMVPSFVVALDHLPLLPNGKVNRQALVGLRSDDGRTKAPPRDDVELRLLDIWQRVLKTPVGVDDDFFALGGHSLLAVTLMSEVQKSFGHDLPLSVLFSAPTVAAQAAVLRQNAPAEAHAVLVPIRAGGRKRPLFLVHPTGGNVLCYLELARHLGADQPLYALQDPGLFSLQPEPPTLPAMAARYVQAVRKVQPEGPYYIGGWSSGGVVAYEMAQQLRQSGAEVGLLALIDSQAHLEPDETPDDGRLVNAIGRLLAYQANAEWEPLAESGTDAPAAVARLHDLAERANLLPPGADDDYVRRLFAVFRDNVSAVSGYRAVPYSRRITLFRARDPMDERIRNAAIHRPVDDPAHNWGQLGNVKIRTVPGDHLSIIAGANAQSMGQALSEVIEETNQVYDLAGATLNWMLGQ